MRPEKKELTEDDKFEHHLQQEAELGRLARTYTILDRNRNQFGGPSGKLAKTRRVLDIFRREQRNILTDLAVASADARKKEDERRSKMLAQLLEEYDTVDEEIKVQKAHLNEIDDQTKMVKKKVLDISSKQITDEQMHQRVIKGEKTVHTLENKLEMQIKKFCAISARNVKLREEIQHLLIERTEFNKIWDKLINNLCIGKKFMLDLIEQATIAYDQREEWVSKLQFLRSKAHNDLLAHIQDMRVMQRKRDNDEKLQQFFAIKGQKRVMRDLEEKKIERRQQNREQLDEQLERYFSIMEEIKTFTGTETIGEIAKQFLDQEEVNFGMFQYVNFLNKEMEEISDELGTLHNEIDEQKQLHMTREGQQGNRLEELNQEFETVEKKANDKTQELRNVEQKLTTIMTGIVYLFKMFRCKNDPLIQLLGHNETINYSNMVLYLEILEKNIQEALVSVFYREKQLYDRNKLKAEQITIPEVKIVPVIDQIENIVTTNPCPLCIEHEQMIRLSIRSSCRCQFLLNTNELIGRCFCKLRSWKHLTHMKNRCSLVMN
ncbi:unnamed protein product [Acanthoscelides obtectus]|uniref:ODAD1 central coiled coil region domain-containing protein n=2 Tax=Acanthoscelides obtectus TaxID=200917 RepID=A0A9P0L0B4_ACAOB|nr:unnamed protein product [Acanthoscelides obtectus]CAK1633695.1 Coiled-coil domain-containing protein 63 [Acanthoscelides obtectus]